MIRLKRFEWRSPQAMDVRTHDVEHNLVITQLLPMVRAVIVDEMQESAKVHHGHWLIS
jgi:hypothetical protein